VAYCRKEVRSSSFLDRAIAPRFAAVCLDLRDSGASLRPGACPRNDEDPGSDFFAIGRRCNHQGQSLRGGFLVAKERFIGLMMEWATDGGG